MTATRDTYRSTTVGAITGDDYMDQVADNLKVFYDASNLPLTSVGGTADAVTATVTPALDVDGLVAGMKFTISWADTNTGPVTLNVNSQGAKPVIKADGSSLASDSLASGLRSLLEYDGSNFRIMSTVLSGGSANGTPRYYDAITSDQTWSKPTGLDDDAMVTVEAWGAGGGGGAGGATGGGGGGGYAVGRFRIADLPASVSVTIGQSAADSGGGNTTFGALLTAYGGGRGGTTADDGGGGGGGELAAGGQAVGITGGSGGAIGGGNGGNGDTGGSDGFDASTVYGGAGGGGGNNGAAAYDGGDAVHGGAGGGGSGSIDGGGGVSIHGGNGGAAGSAGTVPGGGGGANAAGARGEVRIQI